jgi:hypothetical protein
MSFGWIPWDRRAEAGGTRRGWWGWRDARERVIRERVIRERVIRERVIREPVIRALAADRGRLEGHADENGLGG